MSFIATKEYATAPTPIKGGKYFAFTSVSDPYGGFYVQCDKHSEKLIPVPLKWSMGEHPTLEDNILEALETCEGCVEERSYLITRWPDAGMPGGAEL